VSALSRIKTGACLIVLVLWSGSNYALSQGVGFQARLDSPPDFVSRYFDHPNRFSAAMRPKTFPVLSPTLLFNPRLDGADFDNNALRFSTTYYGKKDLIPVSVDADRFLDYRLETTSQKKKSELYRTSLIEAQKGSGREGLSIGVALPKRFDQMFGQGGANLRVSGYRRITFSGRSQWQDAAGSGINKQSKFPALNMEQISRFDIQGTIGTKITVSVSQDNQTDIPLANRLIIRYKGDEDDILKTLEAGNTTLSIPNTSFVGYSQQIQGLFGLKAEAQLGNLRVIGIASQEKGSSESAVISATGEENAVYLRDFAYQEGRIFDLFYPDEEFGPYDSVRQIIVYEEERSIDNAEAEEMTLFLKPDVPSDYKKKTILMRELERDKYELLYGQDSTRSRVAIVFHTSQRRALGVFMQVDRYSATGVLVRSDLIGKERDSLKFLQPLSEEQLPGHPAWNLMWRNCYSIPTNINIEDIEIKVYKGLVGREGTSSSLDYQVVDALAQETYVKILGLDQWNNNITTNKVPDNVIDNRPEVFRPEWGLLIFPQREPFNSDTTYQDQNGTRTNPLSLLTPNIYSYTSTSEKSENSQYYIQLVTKTRSATIRLGRANIIEGSERVTLNGTLLQKGTDYTIQYDFGQVTLLTDEATDPNADVQVEFQYAPYITVQKKTLLGMRAEYECSENLSFGSTVLYKSDKAQDRKPKVGQETAKAMVLDFDIDFSLHPNFLTEAVDALPLVSTEAASRLTVSAEVAQSRPNPNVDGDAYIDDFESAIEKLSLGILRTDWTLSSPPYLNDTALSTRERGTMRWHNPPAIARQDVFEGETAAGQGSLQPLRLVFRPFDLACFNADSVKVKSWGGVMRSFNNRVDANRVQLFEIRAKGGKGKLHFDFGVISEDIDGDGRGDKEDRDGNRQLDIDLKANPPIDEDVGLDTIPDLQETNKCGNPYHSQDNPDPAGDNWWFNEYGKGAGADNERPPVPIGIWSNEWFKDRALTEGDYLYYEWQNGTEGNGDDDLVQGLPDQEALNRVTSSLNTEDAYLTFAIDLSTDTDNPYVDLESERNGWYTYRVPIRDPGVVDTVNPEGSTDIGWSTVSYVRVWFERDPDAPDAPTPTTLATTPLADLIYRTAVDSIWIAEWGFIQSNWHDTLSLVSTLDTVSNFYVAPVSEEDGKFSPPPGVEAYYDKVNRVTESQKGLALVFDSLETGAVGTATKELISTESYSGYRSLKMYVHGSDNLTPSDSLLFFFRLGLDSANYYEFRTYIDSGWSENNAVTIDFNDITALKDKAIQGLKKSTDPVNDSTDVYRVVGRPNLNEITYLVAGVRNDRWDPISGEVWLDELRVTDVRKDVGNAARVTVAGSAADLLSYNLSYEYRDPYFRGLSQATRGGSSNNLGSGRESVQTSYGATLNFHKFLPRSWGARLPLTVGYSEAVETPLLRTNSDIVLPEETREQEKSVSKTYKFSTSEAFSMRGSNILFNALLNRQKVSFSYNRSDRRTVNNPFIFAESYNVRAEYEMGVKKDVRLPLFFWTKPVPIFKKLRDSKLALFPDRWNWSATYNRSLRFQDDKDFNRTSSFSRTLDGKMDLNYKMFNNLTAAYNFSTRRDLTDPDLVNLSLRNPKLGVENTYNQSFRVTYDPKMVNFLSSSFSYSANYSDNYETSTRTRNTTLGRTWGVTGNFRHLDLFGSGWGKKRQASERARTGVRGGARAGQPEEEEEESGPPFYEPVLRAMRFLTGWLQPVSYKYNESFNQAVPGAIEKPPWKYRLGLATDIDFPLGSTTRTPKSGESSAYDLGSGFTLLGGISTTIGYRVQVSRDLVNAGQDRNESKTTSWPDISLRIQKFTTLPLLKPYVNWFIEVFSPRTGYSRQVKESRNIDRGFVTSRTTTVNRNPVLSVNFKVFRALSLSGTVTKSEDLSESFSSTTGEASNQIRTVKKSYALSSKYSFTAPGGIGIPLFGKIKFKSTVSIDFSVKFNSTLEERSKDQGKTYTPFKDESGLQLSPTISYTFSQQIRGGLTGRWQDTNLKGNKKTHIRELQIWTEINF